MRHSRAAGRILQAAAVAAILVFLVRSVAANWQVVRDFDWVFDARYLVPSVLLFALSYALLPWIWGRVLKATGHPIGFADAWDI